MSSSRRALAAIVVLAAALRFAGIGEQSFWLDEAFTKRIVDHGLGDMPDLIRGGENTPPLYYVLAWAWTHVFGACEPGLRSLSALAGTATVPVAYLIGRQVASRAAGLVLAGLVAVSPFLVWYSQESRSYALVVLLASLTLLYALRFGDEPSRRNLVSWSVAAALALATHYFAAFVVAAEVAWMLRRPADRRRVALACIPMLVVGLALVPLALDQRHNGGAQVGSASIASRTGSTAKELLVGKYGGPVRGIGPLCALLVAAALALAFARATPEQRRRLALPLAIGAAVLLMPLALAVAGVDYFAARYVAVAWVPLFAGVAAALALPRARPAGLALAAALGALFLVVSVSVALTPRLQRDDWRSAAAALGRPRTERVILVSPDVGFVPLRVYEPEIEAPPGPRFPVREIDAIVMTRDGRAPPLTPPAPGFRVLATDRDPTYVLARFVSARPRQVTIAALAARRYTPDPTGLVYERAR
ncbi:MAG: mannosyltransferase [Thermoleophilaceae bacterium]|nr:mannosyltransferase [Thermoleophilaceae bacterium]